MSSGRPAALDGSLLARKGNAVPAMSDESPLVLNLEAHRREQTGPEPVNPAPLRPVPVSVGDKQNASVGASDFFAQGLRRVSGLIDLVSSRVRWAAMVVVAVFIVAALWMSNSSREPAPVQAQSPPVTTPATPVRPLEQANVLNPPSPAATMPVPAAQAASATAGATASEELGGAGSVQPSPSAPIIPANTASRENSPSLGDLDTAPKIQGPVPKSVSPIPVPKAKPEVAAVPVPGRYAVQLASIALEKRANEEAFRLQKQFGHILGEHEIKVEKAVIDGKGTMYRLRAGGYRTQAEANSACAQLAKLKVSCLALRR